MSIENPDSHIQPETKVESKTETEIETVEVKNFSEGVSAVLEREQNSESDRESFCLVDIDGALIENDLLKAPFLSHFVKPKISKENEKSFMDLCKGFKDKIAIATNRGEKNNFIWNTGQVIETTRKFLRKLGHKIPIFNLLFKQKLEVSTENIADISKQKGNEKINMVEEDLKISRARAEALVHYIGKAAQEDGRNNLDLYFIEDWSIVSLNRGVFLKYLAEGLKKEYAIDTNLISVVIKSSFL
jgi:6-pyruvoyl-tetrahydropterin synthase